MRKSELTAAIRRYARKHGYYQRTVRDVSAIRYAAIKEWRESQCTEEAKTPAGEKSAPSGVSESETGSEIATLATSVSA